MHLSLPTETVLWGIDSRPLSRVNILSWSTLVAHSMQITASCSALPTL